MSRNYGGDRGVGGGGSLGLLSLEMSVQHLEDLPRELFGKGSYS